MKILYNIDVIFVVFISKNSYGGLKMKKVINSVLSMVLFSLILCGSLFTASAKADESVTSGDLLVMCILSYYDNPQDRPGRFP